MSDRGPHATVDARERLTTPTVEDDRLSRLRADPATGSYARNVCAAHEPGHPNRPTAHAVTDTQARSAVSTNGSVHGLSFRTRRRTRATVGQGPRRTTPPPPTRPDRPIVGIIGALRIVPPNRSNDLAELTINGGRSAWCPVLGALAVMLPGRSRHSADLPDPR